MTGVTILFMSLGTIVALQCLTLLWLERIAKRVKPVEKPVVKIQAPTEFIHCKTQQQFDHMLSIFEGKGWARRSGALPMNRSNYRQEYGDQTVIEHTDNFGYGDLELVSLTNGNIISYEDFLKREGISAPVEVKPTSKKVKKPVPKKPVKRPSKK